MKEERLTIFDSGAIFVVSIALGRLWMIGGEHVVVSFLSFFILTTLTVLAKKK